MSEMNANRIAVVWDFDKTLVKGYMQDPIFEHYHVDSEKFWDEVNALPQFYMDTFGIKVNRDTIYLNHFLTCIKQGIFPGLNNETLREFGKDLVFYDGIPDIFEKTKKRISNNSKYNEFDIKVEHYIVSTGMSEIIKGSSVMQYVDGVWGCEFLEEERQSDLGPKTENGNPEKVISQIAYTIDNTSKTRALFEINKGSNIYPEIDVNGKMPEQFRRIPFKNMIYIADGPSDIPAFSVIKKGGGSTFAIYPKQNTEQFKQVEMLIHQDRIDMYAEADYREGTTAYMWITNRIETIAEKIYEDQKSLLTENSSKTPQHITN